MKSSRAEKIIASILALLGVVLLGMPLLGDEKRDPENYLTLDRREQLETFVNRLLGTDIEVTVFRHPRREPAVSGASTLTRELVQEIASFMDSEGWELLEIQRSPKPMVTLGSYSGRTWAIYVYSPEGPAIANHCSPRLLSGDWYYCNY